MSAIEAMSVILSEMVEASSMSMMALAMAPGPQSIGIERGVIDMSSAYTFTSSSFELGVAVLGLKHVKSYLEDNEAGCDAEAVGRNAEESEQQLTTYRKSYQDKKG